MITRLPSGLFSSSFPRSRPTKRAAERQRTVDKAPLLWGSSHYKVLDEASLITEATLSHSLLSLLNKVHLFTLPRNEIIGRGDLARGKFHIQRLSLSLSAFRHYPSTSQPSPRNLSQTLNASALHLPTSSFYYPISLIPVDSYYWRRPCLSPRISSGGSRVSLTKSFPSPLLHLTASTPLPGPLTLRPSRA